MGILKKSKAKVTKTAKKGTGVIKGKKNVKGKTSTIGKVTGAASRVTDYVTGGLFGISPSGLKSAIKGSPSGLGRRKHVNPLNIKALRRSTSRLARFHKIAGKVEKNLSKLVKKKAGRFPSTHMKR